MKVSIYSFLLLLGCTIGINKARSQAINDHIFPPHAAAKSFINFNKKGFLINGKPTFLVSAGLEYARVPQQLWYDRLLRLKRAGFNCVEIYTLWNFHEPHEGKFVFTGDHDLNRFLDLVKQLDLYAIVRVGPYYCAEWDLGGYPLWLKFKPGLRVREDNEAFVKYVDRYFDKLLPIVCKQQINRGGPVIIVQLENEHNDGWGTAVPNNYFKRLQSKALAQGLQVPYFFSGLHHASDPAGDGTLDDAARPNPWFSTEFWSVWYSQYGAKPADSAVYARRTWKIIAHGGGGYNYYMAHGGSNFNYSNNDEDAASYDYGAAVGQAGDLRPIYFAFKRAGFFARSFQDVLADGTDATAAYKSLLADTTLKITARKSDAGEVIFLDNPGNTVMEKSIVVDAKLPAAHLKLSAGEIYPLVHNYHINDKVKLKWALTRIYGLFKQGNTATILVEVPEGGKALLNFETVQNAIFTKGKQRFSVNGQSVILQTENKPGFEKEYIFEVGDKRIRVLIADAAGMDKTWATEVADANAIVSGPSYLGDVVVKNNRVQFEAEQPLAGLSMSDAMLYTEKASVVLKSIHQPNLKVPSKLILSPWQHKNAAVYATGNFNDSKWFASANPLQMGADGNLTADAWYRTHLNIPLNGKYTLQIAGGGRAIAFVDGVKVASWKIADSELSLPLKRGKHTLAIFTAHDGRDKLAAYTGAITDVDPKGISGPVSIKKGGPFISTLQNWYFKKAHGAGEVKNGIPQSDTVNWQKYNIGDDAFNKQEGYGWFETIIPVQAGAISKLTISFKSVDEDAIVFINGRQVASHNGWNSPFKVEVNNAEILQKPVRLTIFVSNHSNEGGIDQPVKINSIGKATTVRGWKMLGGPGNIADQRGWKKLFVGTVYTGPQLYRSAFVLPAAKGKELIWRVHTDGLSYGSVWVNGHNLGRYPEKIGDIGMYIPSCWLIPGSNQLVIYDENGKRPGMVSIQLEKQASRVIYSLEGK
ncbi:beta-galactosidase [Mucilaginibacter phyllosphaerae]|uniref:Beta-galactosidase n=1 Tax=Mucilaginibacter phyllosphaerae TaxID=1812349 RepID=A0A4Y8AJR0_9SPHI|nr:beta-galactosidase [Mucilaginibacter phyllosphaerae]MBB3968254.1 beta-galactosidase [Mucilaginibacter phyllosphaerae]TEW68739.1 hypothetical protein E2R65_00820 [Mucilaginibacter phyllosphaerae]GGH00165.1 hypothetical protein GCM10007352_01370 [Mucilaginibacter phyllosphaerae]